jgi:outer membrane protein OmpA-like peptidoglycan-associated protein
MTRPIRAITVLITIVLFVSLVRVSAAGQDGKLRLHVTPHQAYVFVDGRAISEASKCRNLKLSAGNHKVELVNYGYTPEVHDVVINAGETTDLEASLTAVSSSVSGPFGAITIEGASRKAVLLNGNTPDFFVGHGDEFNHEWGWKQELVVPPGTYQLTVRSGDSEAWSGPVTVNANERVVVRVPKGISKTVPWPRGEKLTSVPRFTAGTASATVAVARPTAQLSAGATSISCGDTSQIKWTTSDAPQVEVAPIGTVAPSGEQSVRLTQTTNYQLTAVGPGGKVTSDATVNVNTDIQAHVEFSPAQVQYKRIGDKILEEGNTSLNWSSSNASTVSIDPVGTVAANGNRAIQIKPQKTDAGPVDETVTYTLSAKNECGGTTTQTATLRIIGSIEPPELAMRSVYFQTDVPTAKKKSAGLLKSEQDELRSIAESFNRYVAMDPSAKLMLAGHADERGSGEYNQGLSERRAELVKQFLTDQGVSADHLETQAFGEKQNLSADDVKGLLKQNPSLSDEDRLRDMWKFRSLVLANNRRVDINLTTTGQQSRREFPYKAEDASELIDRNGPLSKSTVQLAAKTEKIAK